MRSIWDGMGGGGREEEGSAGVYTRTTSSIGESGFLSFSGYMAGRVGTHSIQPLYKRAGRYCTTRPD